MHSPSACMCRKPDTSASVTAVTFVSASTPAFASGSFVKSNGTVAWAPIPSGCSSTFDSEVMATSSLLSIPKRVSRKVETAPTKAAACRNTTFICRMPSSFAFSFKRSLSEIVITGRLAMPREKSSLLRSIMTLLLVTGTSNALNVDVSTARVGSFCSASVAPAISPIVKTPSSTAEMKRLTFSKSWSTTMQIPMPSKTQHPIAIRTVQIPRFRWRQQHLHLLKSPYLLTRKPASPPVSEQHVTARRSVRSVA
mmetsp:Transcript_98534/g.175519  ORF Transcript_98534/g.175519 Transcript_98534/m.175519 type:complete len:253 (-) Transcript_98534:75-833(-)